MSGEVMLRRIASPLFFCLSKAVLRRRRPSHRLPSPPAKSLTSSPSGDRVDIRWLVFVTGHEPRSPIGGARRSCITRKLPVGVSQTTPKPMIMNAARFEPIDHLEDARLAPYANLRHAAAQRRGEHFIVEGRLPVERLIASQYAVESVVVERGHEQPFAAQMDAHTSIYSLPREQLKQLVGFDFHRGVMACGRRLPLRSIDRFRFADNDPPVALAVIGVTELENLGSIFRSAACFGIRHVLIGPKTIDPLARRVIRVSMANVFGLELYQLDEPEIQLAGLRERMNLRSIATTLDHHATPLCEFMNDDRAMVLIIGNEATGLDPQIQRAATDRVTIPMQLGTDSLNVAVAAALFMHQLTRSRSCKPIG